MATIKEEFYFNFDGVNSKDFNLLAVDLGSGLYEEILAPSRTINQTETNNKRRRTRNIFHNIQEGTRSFELNLAFEEGYTEESLDEIVRWLFKDYYKPLYFENKENRVMFAMISGDSTIVHNGLNQGYFTVTVETNSPYLFSQLKTGGRTITNTGVLTLENDGHLPVFPEFSIKKNGNGDLRFDTQDGNVLIVNLTNGEELYIDTMRGIIETDVLGEYRYDNIRAGELEDLFLGVGNKEYAITGSCRIDYRYREAYRV